MRSRLRKAYVAGWAYGVSEPKPEGAPKRSDGGLRVRSHGFVSAIAWIGPRE